MAVGIAVDQANALLDAFCRSVAYSDPVAFWVKLHLGDPGSDGTGNPATETARQQASFSAASGGAITTSADLTWSAVAASEEFSHVSFWDDETAGSFLGSDDLASPQSVIAGNAFVIAAGEIDLSLTPVAA